MLLKKFPEVIKKRPRLRDIPPKVELIILGSTALLAAFSAVLLPYRSQFLSARILEFTGYTVGCLAAAGCSSKIDTPAKREKREKDKLDDLKTREEKILEREMALEKAKLEANQALQQRETEFIAFQQQRLEEIQGQYEAQISQLRAEIAALNAPQLDPGALNQNNNCNRLIQYLWRKHDIILDHRETMYDPETKTEKYIAQLRDPGDIRKLRDEKLLMELEALMNTHKEGLITVSQLGANVVISYALGVDSREIQLKKSEALLREKEGKITTVEQCLSYGLGFLISGSSGSAKTATACYIAQSVIEGDSSALIYILDIHATINKARYWDKYGYHFVTQKALNCVRELERIFDEYRNRESGESQRSDRVVCIIDEFEEWLGVVELELGLMECPDKDIKKQLNKIVLMVKSLATGGRKFNINIILINQSYNCRALRLDGNHRRNFVQIHLNTNAEAFLDSNGGWNDELEVYLKEDRLDKYRGIVTGVCTPKPFKHPTHYQYDFIANKQPPLGLVKVSQFTTHNESSTNLNPEPFNGDLNVHRESSQHHRESSACDDSEWLERLYSLPCDDIRTPVNGSETPDLSKITASQGTAPKCPHCGSQNHSKNGSYNGKQRLKCRDCNKSFYP